MKAGSAIFLIVVILLGIFIGSGYLISQQLQTAGDLETCRQQVGSVSASNSQLNGDLQAITTRLNDVTHQLDLEQVAHKQDHDAFQEAQIVVQTISTQLEQVKNDLQNARDAQQQAEAQVGWMQQQMELKDTSAKNIQEENQHLREENTALLTAQNERAPGIDLLDKALQAKGNPLTAALITSAGWLGLTSLGYAGSRLRRRARPQKTVQKEVWVRMSREEAQRYGRSRRQG